MRSLRDLVTAVAVVALSIFGSGCSTGSTRPFQPIPGSIHVGILLLDRVYNSELMAPYDVLQHTVFHTDPGMRVFTVGRSTAVVESFEGLRLVPDYALEDAPRIDVLVVPSSEHNMDSDLEDRRLLDWIRDRGGAARWVLSVCDGAFLLAEAGLLDGLACTTFPGDLDAFRARYPQLDVRTDVEFVADGNAITGAGGAKSYEPAFWLVERLYGADVARGVGRGLVVDWDLTEVPHALGPRLPARAPEEVGR